MAIPDADSDLKYVEDKFVAQVAAAAGFGGEDNPAQLSVAVSIALAENLGKPTALAGRKPGQVPINQISLTGDLGLFQINKYWHVDRGFKFDMAKLRSDPFYNAECAFKVYTARKKLDGLGWSAWSTWPLLSNLYRTRAAKAVEESGKLVQGPQGGNWATSLDDWKNGLGDFLGKLTSVNTWIRVAAVVGGAILLFFGLRIFMSEVAAPAVRAVTA